MERKAKQSALEAEKQRIQYEIANSTGATREEWKYKLALWRLKKAQADQDHALANTQPSKAYTGAASRFEHRKTEHPGFQMKTKKVPVEPNRNGQV
jgi:hypothetical protein